MLAIVAALLTLTMATHIGVRDICCWTTPETQASLRNVSGIWRLITMATAAALSIGGSVLLTTLVMSALCGVFAGLLCALARIDMRCRLLPDQLTLLLVITGFGFHWFSDALSIADALIGAMAGYLTLWLLAWIFKRYRATEAMGRGDFAMAAGLGAWLGWQLLPLALMIASIAALIAVASSRLIATTRISPHANPSIRFMQMETAFGPALAIGALAAWMVPLG